MAVVRNIGRGPFIYHYIFRNQRVGQAKMNPVHENRVDYLKVVEAYQKKGFGSELLNMIEKDVREMKVWDTVQVCAIDDYTRKWVEKRGYTPIKRGILERKWYAVGSDMTHYKFV